MLLIILFVIPLIGILIISTVFHSDNGKLFRLDKGSINISLLAVVALLPCSIKMPTSFCASELDMPYIYVIVGACVTIIIATVKLLLSDDKFITRRHLFVIFISSILLGIVAWKFREYGIYWPIELVGYFGVSSRFLLYDGLSYAESNNLSPGHKVITFKSNIGDSNNNGTVTASGSNNSEPISDVTKASIIKATSRNPLALYSAQLCAEGEINRLRYERAQLERTQLERTQLEGTQLEKTELEKAELNAKLKLIDDSIRYLKEGSASFTKVATESEISNSEDKK